MDIASPSVFLVDDSAPTREIVKELIDIVGPVRVVGEAQTAGAAIDQINAAQPDFVVLDYHLRDGTGLDVLRSVRKSAPNTCFIVLTNHASAVLRKAFEDAGAQFFLDKSHDFGRLGQIVAGVHPPQP